MQAKRASSNYSGAELVTAQQWLESELDERMVRRHTEVPQCIG